MRATVSDLPERIWVRVAGAAAALVIVVALALVWRGAEAMRGQLAEDFNQQQLALARQASAAIAHRLQDVEEEAVAMARLMTRVRLRQEVEGAVLEAMLGRCRALGVRAIEVRGADGRIAVRRGEALPGTPAVPMAPEPAGLWVGVALRPAPEGRGGAVAGEVAVSFTAADGERRQLACRLDVSALIREAVGRVRSGRTGYAWVVDGRGVFLFHPDHSFIGRDAFRARHERAPELDFSSIDHIMRDRMLAGEEGTGRYVSGWHGGLSGRIHKLIAFSPMVPPRAWGAKAWSVAVVAPESELAGAAQRLFVGQAAAGAVLVLALLLVAATVVATERRAVRLLRERVERTEAELADVERIAHRVVEQASDLIYLLDLEGRLVLANPAAVALFSRLEGARWQGVTPPPADRYVGRPLAELFEPEVLRHLEEHVDRVLFCASRTAFEQTVRVDGELRRLSTRLVPVRDETRRIHYVLGIARDVTERQLVEQRLYHAEKLASIGTLAAGVAHEINNPLAVILGYAELLRDRLPKGSTEREDAEVIIGQATAAKRVVDGLLGFARVTEGLEETVDVGAAVEQVAAIVRNTMMTRKISLEVDVEPGLPRVAGDPREFQQVVFNLVTNAVGALEEGGGRIAIRARASGYGWVEVEVEDDGCGIPERIRNRIFDPFFTTKPVGKGTGLGLSLAYGIVSKYGGSIAFHSVSREDRPEGPTGTTFTVRLPVAGGAGGGEG